jgi:hypothetical protein
MVQTRTIIAFLLALFAGPAVAINGFGFIEKGRCRFRSVVVCGASLIRPRSSRRECDKRGERVEYLLKGRRYAKQLRH